jgi:hypothetical protein
MWALAGTGFRCDSLHLNNLHRPLAHSNPRSRVAENIPTPKRRIAPRPQFVENEGTRLGGCHEGLGRCGAVRRADGVRV